MSANTDDQDQSDLALLLPEVMDLRAATPLACELLARRGRNVEVDASRVRRLGGQCLQVLLSARACWKSEGVRFRVTAPSSEFTDGLALLGASSFVPNSEA